MNLGERIYRLRTQRSLSQGDLADMLEVSRQSVSKWENNSAVPDLERIIRLSEIFEVSLDELVKGERVTTPKQAAPTDGTNTEKAAESRLQNEASSESASADKSGFPPRKIAGTILLCMAFLTVLVFTVFGGMLAGLIFASPFLLCGIICFVFRENVGLWCSWAVFAAVDVYIRWAMGISWSIIRWTLHYEPSMNYGRLAIGWVQFLCMVILVIVTAVRFRNKPMDDSAKSFAKLTGSWCCWILVGVLMQMISQVFSQYLLAGIVSVARGYNVISSFLSWLQFAVFAAAVTYTVRYIRSRKNWKEQSKI